MACWGAGVLLPSVTIEYRDVKVEADALVGSAGIPSLFNVARAFLKVLSLPQSFHCSSSTKEAVIALRLLQHH